MEQGEGGKGGGGRKIWWWCEREGRVGRSGGG